MGEREGQTAGIISTRAGLIEVVAIAVVGGLGVNLLAAGLGDRFQWSATLSVAVGGILTVGSFLYLCVRAVPRISKIFPFEGVLVVSRRGQKPTEIPRYEFSEDSARYLQALMVENKALERLWTGNPLSSFDVEDGAHVVRPSPSSKLLREIVEYYILNELSLHLSAHFENNPRVADGAIKRLGRRDIPSVLLDNRCLELFSRPMEEREAFVPPGGASKRKDGPPQGKVVWASGKDGAIYDAFELILPARATAARGTDGSLQVRTRRVDLHVTVRFDGTNANLPRDFERLYLGCPFGDVTVYAVGVTVNVRFAWWALLTAAGWEYYRWLDSFIERIEAGFSFDRFLTDIGWDAARTIVQLQRHVDRGKGAG